MTQQQPQTKAEARADARLRRNALALSYRVAAAGRLAAHLAALPAWRAARTVAGYVPIASEADVALALAEVIARGDRVALPRIIRHERRLVFHHVTDLAALVPGAYGIPEPPPDAPVVGPEEIALILVPGLAFDPSGARLGYGGGYYDRYLPLTPALRVGVAFTCQILPALPQGPHDTRVHHLATEDAVLPCPAPRA